MSQGTSWFLTQAVKTHYNSVETEYIHKGEDEDSRHFRKSKASRRGWEAGESKGMEKITSELRTEHCPVVLAKQ